MNLIHLSTRLLEYKYIFGKYTMIFSINVHENVPFLLKQLANIEEYVTEPHWIILSCNEYMYTALQDVTLPSHVILNPEVIQKK